MSGTTADKLNYLKNTKESLRQEINNDFPDLNLTTSSTFRQYPSKMASSQLWMDAWISGNVLLNVIYNGTDGIDLSDRTFNNILMPNSVTKYLDGVTAKTLIIGGPTSVSGSIFRRCNFSEVYVNNLQTISDGALYSNSGLYPTKVGKLHLPSLTSATGKKGTFTNTYAISEDNVYLPRIQNIGAFGLKGTNFHIGTELSTVCNLAAGSGVSQVTNIYVPASLVNSYKSATNWSNYADNIKAEPGT